ncbi:MULTISPECIES: hypothetical protein [unclassified Cellulomonas]|uniref:hypothetical protein n=1 Tax=unclassified Cellulomonas TaxID=2620175 RepID=UPI001C4FE4B0|nr:MULTISPECIES: hypothetical protein [unclassified Cellulomonas]MBW0254429.1 hypothetical protein [Cellulomonas sp. PS-H5]MCG7284657.1 hypothetical protein [Cellulomonas sp. ACRRI]
MLKEVTTTALAVGLVLLGTAPAIAAGAPSPDVPLTQGEPGDGVVNDDTALRAELDALAAVQSEDEVDAILNSGQQVQALYDVEAGEYVSAFVEEPTIVTRAITQRGPGCASGDACIVNKTIGFYGTGQLTFKSSISGVTKVSAGNKVTTWWRSATVGVYQNVNVTTTFTSPITLVSITRS